MPTPPTLRRTAAAALVAVALSGAACGSSGRELRDPAPGATAQTRVPDPSLTSTTTSALGQLGSPGSGQVGFTVPPVLPTSVMNLSSPDWTPGATLPDEHACGSTTPPTLEWTGVPDGAVELAVFAVDLDATEVLWIVTGIPTVATSLDMAALPSGVVALPNDRGNAGWDGPCPADRTHTVQFELLALPAPSTTATGTPRQLRDTLFGQAVGYGILSAPVTAPGGS